MSLIQEALKRKDEENSGIVTRAIPIIPPAASELPVKQPDFFSELSVPSVKGKTVRAWPVLMISLLVITILALTSVGLLLYSARLLVQQGQQAEAAAATDSLAISLSTGIVQDGIRERKPAPAEVSAAVAADPLAISISTGIVQDGTTERKPAPAEVSAVAVLPPVTWPSSWPRLKVVGVMARPSVQDVAAIIDGNLVECGDEIRGVKVHGVNKSGVWFVFKSQTQFVRVGQTTL